MLTRQAPIGGLGSSTGSRATFLQATWKKSHPAPRPIPLLVILRRRPHPSRIRAARHLSIMGLPRMDTSLSYSALIVHIHQVNQFYPSKFSFSKRGLRSTSIVMVATARRLVPEIFTQGSLQLLINGRLQMVHYMVNHLSMVRALYHDR